MIARAIAIAALLGAAACSDEPPLFGPPTEAECPPGSPLTWETFGRDFMFAYCTDCHHSELVGADRNGAPSFHDFDTVFGVRAVRVHIDETSASGPAATNTSMPNEGPRPTLEERRLLGEWLACGVPSTEFPD